VIASHWIQRVEGGDNGASTQRQLCASRKLVEEFAGVATWNKVRTTAVERSSVTGGARIAKATGRC